MDWVTMVFMLLPLVQLVTVPASAAARGYSGVAWFVIVLVWLAIMFPVWILGLPLAVAAALSLPVLGASGGASGLAVGAIVGLAVALLCLGLSFGPAIALRAITPRSDARRYARTFSARTRARRRRRRRG